MIGGIPETEKERNADKRQEVEEEWEEMEEISDVNCDNQTDQLEAMRFEMKSKIPIYQVRKARRYRKNEMPGTRGEIPKEAYDKYGDAAGKIEIDAVGKHGAFYEFLSREFRRGGGGGFVDRRTNSPHSGK